MNTKLLMTSTCILLGAAGIFALFLPEQILSMQGVGITAGASLLVQMLGGFYFAFAMMNWAAKDSVIGGIYARPTSLANFSHFFSGALLFLKYDFSNTTNPFVWAATAVYIFFALCFYWLVFRATGTKS